MNIQRNRPIFEVILVVIMLFSFSANVFSVNLFGVNVFGENELGMKESVQAATNAKSIDVMFSHDMHSHFKSFSIVEDGQTKTVGGFARIKTLIDKQLENNPDTLVVDAGDYSMGTLVQTIFDTEAAELRMLGHLGYDVTTLGNHEFDYRSEGIARMLTAASQSGDDLPEMVICNVDWDKMKAEGLSDNQKMIYDAFEEYGIKDYVVVEKGDLKFAVFGVFGKKSLEYSPTCELLMKDPVEAAKETVKKIKKNEDVDCIVCVSHSGTDENIKQSEDEILAKNVPDIDLIISGHTHSILESPIVHGDTTIVSCGEYGRRIGSISLKQTKNGRWKYDNYELIQVNEDIPEDAATNELIDEFISKVDKQYLSQFGYTSNQVLASNDISFGELRDLEFDHVEQNMGSIIADSYIYGYEHSSDYDGIPATCSILPAGLIRDTFAKGDITIEDVYNTYSLGIGADGVSGYPLISIYLNGDEVKMATEIDASLSDFMVTARLYCSRLNFTFNPHRIILNKVSDCYALSPEGEKIELEDDKLYCVITDLYSAQMLGSVTDLSKGLLSIVPKNEDGTAVTDFEQRIIYDNGKELKAWYALAEYLDSFEDTNGDGISDVPSAYATKQGRKVVDDSWNIVKLVKNPNRYAFMIIGLVTLVIVLVVIIILGIRKLILRRLRKS